MLNLVKRIISIYAFFLTKKSRSISYLDSRIILFNTHDKGGGAAKICHQLFESIPESTMFVREKRLHEKNIFEFDPDLWNRIGTIARSVEKKRGILDFGKIGVLKLLTNLKFQESNLIHLHNIHGYYLSFYALEKISSKKKLIWTLHDDYILTGHCSFAMTCEKWLNGCGNCPSLNVYPSLSSDTTELNLKEKIKSIKKMQPYIVTPSKWLAERVARKYPFLEGVNVIYNGVDINVFKPSSEIISLKIKNKIPLDKKVILFIAELSVNNPFKGGDILMEIVDFFQQKSEYIFLTVGGINSDKYPNVISLPYINEDVKLAELYNLADVMLYPTKADNLPLVVLESMACGTPVIASNIAGIPEIIDHTKNGYLIDNSIVSDFINSIELLFNLSDELKIEMSNAAHEKIRDKFSLDLMIDNYRSIYNLLLSN